MSCFTLVTTNCKFIHNISANYVILNCNPGKCIYGDDENSCLECISGKVLLNGTCILSDCPSSYYVS